MKSAEKYWISVVNLLEDKITVTNANPQLIKDDTKALNGLGGLFLMQLPPICSTYQFLPLLITSDEFDPKTCKSFFKNP